VKQTDGCDSVIMRSVYVRVHTIHSECSETAASVLTAWYGLEGGSYGTGIKSCEVLWQHGMLTLFELATGLPL
jgi:hypothetical protein